MNTLQASEGKWLYNGETFAKAISSYGDLSAWQEVSDEYKAQWEAEHPTEVSDKTSEEMLEELNDIVNE